MPGRLAAACVLVASCGPSSAQRDEQRVLSGIERIEKSAELDHAGRQALAAELLALDVKSAPAVRARDACGRYYATLAQANLITQSLQAELADTSTKSDPRDVAERLKKAEDLLAGGDRELEACTSAKLDLVSKQ